MWIVSLAVLAQDLFQRPDPDRLDLRLAPCVEAPRRAATGVSASLDLGGALACGKFDLGSSFRAQFDRQVGEEFLQSALGAVESELASDALVLACQLSPTICDAIKHYRLTASTLLSLQQGQCRSLEEVVSGASQKIRAQAILACVEERRKAGDSLDRALERCQEAQGVRDLSGRETREIDVIRETSRFLKLDGELDELLRAVGQPVKIGGNAISADLNLDGLGRIYAQTREGFENRWRELILTHAQGKSLTPEMLRTLTPRGASPIRSAEVARLATMPEERREAVIRSLSTAAAYLDLAERIEEVEKRIQAVDGSPTSQEMGPILAKEREWLRAERDRLDERVRRQSFYNDAMVRALGALDADLDRAFRARLAPARDAAVTRRAFADTKPWGGCGKCDAATYSLGTVRKR